MSFHQTSGGIGRSLPTTLAEINVVPLIDIMLVLLITFMISAPLMQQGTQIELPKANTGALPDIADQIVLEISSNRLIKMNGVEIKKGTLRDKLEALAQVKPEIQVFVKADKKIEYGFLAKVISEIKKSKINRVGLVTLPEVNDGKL